MAPKSRDCPHTVNLPGFTKLFSRYILRKYQVYQGPGKLVASLLPNQRESNGGGVSPFR